MYLSQIKLQINNNITIKAKITNKQADNKINQ